MTETNDLNELRRELGEAREQLSGLYARFRTLTAVEQRTRRAQRDAMAETLRTRIEQLEQRIGELSGDAKTLGEKVYLAWWGKDAKWAHPASWEDLSEQVQSSWEAAAAVAFELGRDAERKRVSTALELLESEVERRKAQLESPQKGMGSSIRIGDFASAPPSVISRLCWHLRNIRGAS